MTLLSDTVFIQNKHKYVKKYSSSNFFPEPNNHCISIHYYSIPFVFIGRNFQFYFDLIFSQSILSLFYLSRYVSFFGNHIWCALLGPAWNVILKLLKKDTAASSSYLFVVVAILGLSFLRVVIPWLITQLYI